MTRRRAVSPLSRHADPTGWPTSERGIRSWKARPAGAWLGCWVQVSRARPREPPGATAGPDRNTQHHGFAHVRRGALGPLGSRYPTKKPADAANAVSPAPARCRMAARPASGRGRVDRARADTRSPGGQAPRHHRPPGAVTRPPPVPGVTAAPGTAEVSKCQDRTSPRSWPRHRGQRTGTPPVPGYHARHVCTAPRRDRATAGPGGTGPGPPDTVRCCPAVRLAVHHGRALRRKRRTGPHHRGATTVSVRPRAARQPTNGHGHGQWFGAPYAKHLPHLDRHDYCPRLGHPRRPARIHTAGRRPWRTAATAKPPPGGRGPSIGAADLRPDPTVEHGP